MAMVISSPAVMIFLSLLCVVVSVGPSEAYGPREVVGGRREIVAVRENKEVQELGRFSVDEYNRRRRGSALRRRGDNGGELRFVEVVEAQRQVVSGIKYYLKVAAEAAAAETAEAGAEETGRERRTFDSVVVVRPWLKSKQLLGFSPTNDHGVRS